MDVLGKITDRELSGKVADLLERLRALPSVLVAFSGGVDSSLLAVMAQLALGDRALAVTSFPRCCHSLTSKPPGRLPSSMAYATHGSNLTRCSVRNCYPILPTVVIIAKPRYFRRCGGRRRIAG